MSSTERAAPFYCPYCAEEDLRPVEEPARPPAVEAVTGAWRCTACLRVFVVKFVGLAARTGTARTGPAHTGTARTGTAR